MTRPEDRRPITHGTYREDRSYLADHVFLQVPGPKDPTPLDLLDEERWESLMALPTDVLLRTTDHLGPMVEDMGELAHGWIRSMPDESTKVPYLFEACLDAHDEFHAAPFIAAHGWYRQATAALRNALELMAHGARYAITNDRTGHSAWRAGTTKPQFGNSRDILMRQPTIESIDRKLGSGGVFAKTPPGVLVELYDDVCRYAHSTPGYTNADIWRSNGPVFIPRAFTRFWLDFCDVIVACYVLFKIGYPPLVMPAGLDEVAGNAGDSWHGLAPATLNAYFG
jgi:hypothetical protein